MMRSRFNFPYLLLLFIFLAFTHILTLFHETELTVFARCLFSFDALLQLFLELWLIAYIAQFLKGVPLVGFLFLTFWLCLGQIIDYFTLHFIGAHVWKLSFIMLSENLKNFIEVLRASNVTFKVSALIFLAILLTSALGPVLYYLCKKIPTPSKFPHLFRSSCALSLLFMNDLLFIPKDRLETYDRAAKILPFKTTFFVPKEKVIPIPSFPTLREPVLIAKDASSLPSIYLFIIESLREDYITPEIAPHIFAFKQANTCFSKAFSGSNCTHNSWFTIFYSAYGFLWNASHKLQGSPHIAALKQAGYTICAYVTPELDFYDMGTKIFGPGFCLLDEKYFFPHYADIKAWESDRAAIETLIQCARAPDEKPRLHSTFIDLTHFDYSWPEKKSRFTPFTPVINYVKGVYDTHELDQIRNRYKNAIWNVDRLFGKFLKNLDDPNAVIVITGDHGEEFKEHGQIFHASNLSDEQTHVPLYFRFGSHVPLPTVDIASHLDIFPTLFDFIFRETRYNSHGFSLLSPLHPGFAVSARYNGGLNPTEFYIHNGLKKCTFRFANPYDIASSSNLTIFSLEDANGSRLEPNLTTIETEFGKPLAHIFGK